MKKLVLSVVVTMWVCGALGMNHEDKNNQSLGDAIISLPKDMQRIVVDYVGGNPLDQLSNVSKKWVLQCPGHVLASAVSDDNKLVVTATIDFNKISCEVTLWNVDLGRKVNSFNVKRNYIRAVAIHPDKKSVDISFVHDHQNKQNMQITETYSTPAHSTEWRWSIANSYEHPIVEGIPTGASPIFSADNQFILLNGMCSSGDENAEIISVDKSPRMLYKLLNGHTAYVSSLAMSKNNSLIVTGSKDATAIVWDNSLYVKTKENFEGAMIKFFLPNDNEKSGYGRLRAYLFSKWYEAKSKGEKLIVDSRKQLGKDGKEHRGFMWNIYQHCFDHEARKKLSLHMIDKAQVYNNMSPEMKKIWSE